MAESLDFQINDLKFRAAISDKFPYARATAPFRKEQFDAAPTVGDQSLSGWWTRGQMSFHKGAGVKYYEVLEGDEVLGRFDSSLGVDVLPEPGQATLHWDVVDSTTASLTTGLTWADGLPVKVGVDQVAYIDGGTLYMAPSGGAATAHTMVDGSAPDVASVAPSLYCAFVLTTGKSIEKHFPYSVAASTQLYTHSETFQAVFYEKERLWVIDALGDIYTLAADASTPTAITAGDKLVSTGRTSSYQWSITATPSDVYLADGTNTIYRVTLDPDGSVPTLSVPIVAAELPQGERVVFVKAHLGMVVIGTNNGLRVAAPADGGLVYGPIHDVGACGVGATVSGTSVWFVAGAEYSTLFDANYLTELDLNTTTGDLQFAWARRVPVGASDDRRVGAITIASSVGYFKGTDQFGVEVGEIKHRRGTGSLVSPGWLQTAYHRLGTLDSKRFVEVLVRADGDGTIEVFQVDSEGVEASLGSMTVVSSDKDTKTKAFRFLYTEPIERTALKFSLTSSTATDGPILLGYQIKALPSPKRQRLIQWPVVATDAVRDRYGVERGKRGSAWEAWEALEALEENDALVTYTDHRTSETGEAFIENIELQSDTPSQGATSGFGGIGMITLRKVS